MSDFDFTPDQLAAILSNSNMVITACPGSGKTSIIVEKIRNELIHLPSYRGVIGISFTVKASQELRNRCKKNSFDTKASFFGTIDHLCLSEIIYPFLARYIQRKKHDIQCVTFSDLPENIQLDLKEITQYEGAFESGLFETFRNDIELLYEHGFVLLELLGVISNHILENSFSCRRYIQARYNSVYIDEYQDSSEPQHALFQGLLSLGLTAVAVGDVQQSIYAWRGSDPTFIAELANTPEVFEHHIVNMNHRCHPSITNYANRLYDPDSNLLPTDEIRMYRSYYQGTQIDVATKVGESILNAVDKKYVDSFSKIAVLVRNNITLEFVGENLGVPCRVFDEDPLAIRNNISCNIFSCLLRYIFDHKYCLYDVIDFIQSNTITKLKDSAATRKKIESLRNEGELYPRILSVATEILGSEIDKHDRGILELICSDQNYFKHYKPIDDNEVQVMTLHKSKGLEFDLVYHLDLYDWVHPKRVYIQGCYDEVFDDWDQELNLHYVGITRAKKYCVLVTSNRRINSQRQERLGKPSQFLSMPGLDGLYH